MKLTFKKIDSAHFFFSAALFFAAALSAQAKEYICLENLPEQKVAILKIFRSQPVQYFSNFLNEGGPGPTTVSPQTLLSPSIVCGQPFDFAKNCSVRERTASGQYDFDFKCTNSAAGEVYFDEGGGHHLSYSFPGFPAQNLDASDCQEIQAPSSSVALSPAYHILRFTHHNGTECIRDPDRSVHYGIITEADPNDSSVGSLKLNTYPTKSPDFFKAELLAKTLRKTGEHRVVMVLRKSTLDALIKDWTNTPKQKLFAVTMDPRCANASTHLVLSYDQWFELKH